MTINQAKRYLMTVTCCFIAAFAAVSCGPQSIVSPTPNPIPLGVEGVVVVRSSGPELEPAPFKAGAPVTVRIAGKKKMDDGSTAYDIRFYIAKTGTYNILKYLRDAKGTPVKLPPVNITGTSILPKDYDGKLKLLGPIKIPVWNGYYVMLTLLGIGWVVWLLLLIFYKRDWKHKEEVVEKGTPLFADLLRPLIEAARDGSLTSDNKKSMELLLLHHWHKKLKLSKESLSRCFSIIRQDPELGPILGMVEEWLHSPREVDMVKLVQILNDYCDNTAAREERK